MYLDSSTADSPYVDILVPAVDVPAPVAAPVSAPSAWAEPEIVDVIDVPVVDQDHGLAGSFDWGAIASSPVYRPQQPQQQQQ